MKNWQKIKQDPQLRQKYSQRSRIIKAIRDFFWEHNFLEVETPQLVNLPSMEPYLEVFETTLIDDQRETYRGFLTSSPEFAMKKLLAAGYENIFQICKSYRNQEGWSTRHNPEFTILEWYRTNADYTQVMTDCEEMFRFIGQRLGMKTLQFRGKSFDLNQPWERITVAEAFLKYSNISADDVLDEQALRKHALQKGYQVDENTTWEEMYNQIFLNEIEPFLGQEKPTILYEYPVQQAALSRKKESDPRWAERFEFYLAGLELGNAFGELTDAKEQLMRLKEDRAEKERLDRTLFDIDMDFIAALEAGIPPTSGIAVGIDRVCMIFMNAESIQDTLFFPAIEMWKPKG